MVSIIIPVFNEAATLPTLLARVAAAPFMKEVIAVDDGSTDDSGELLRAVSREWQTSGDPVKRLIVLQHGVNRGKGAAVRTALAHASGTITLIQDADLEYDPKDYPALLAPLLEERLDAVYGSRFLGVRKRRGYRLNAFANALLTRFANRLLTGLELTDLTSCYKAFRTELLRELPLVQERFGFEAEVTAQLAERGAWIREVPVSYDPRSYAQGKKIRWRDAWPIVQVILGSAARSLGGGEPIVIRRR
ncbi:glycosyltransferase family 2 protein [Alkalilimnicola ehrlichii]|uniref:glycosyltransferase family 2 protein n=1 Tax=Alkalilimnicola ehrlichii TaxID=351052 RepID=UPI0021616E79|nr:glycosyltransferase family 2 protein [Alkalilimnicola ehrlichii]